MRFKIIGKFLISIYLIFTGIFIQTSAVKGAPMLSVLSWNLLGPNTQDAGNFFNKGDYARVYRQIERIKNARASVLCLQEVDKKSLEQLKTDFENDYHFVSYQRKGMNGGTVLFVKKTDFDVLKGQGVDLGDDGAAAVGLVKSKKTGSIFAISSLHLSRGNTDKGQFGPANKANGEAQLKKLQEAVAKMEQAGHIDPKNVHKIYAGDYNTDKNEVAESTLEFLGKNDKNTYSDAFARTDTVNDKDGNRKGIDHIAASSGVVKVDNLSKIIGNETGKNIHAQVESDHALLYGVYLDPKTGQEQLTPEKMPAEKTVTASESQKKTVVVTQNTDDEKFENNVKDFYASTDRWAKDWRANSYVTWVKELPNSVQEVLKEFASQNFTEEAKQNLLQNPAEISEDITIAIATIEKKNSIFHWTGKAELLQHLKAIKDLTATAKKISKGQEPLKATESPVFLPKPTSSISAAPVSMVPKPVNTEDKQPVQKSAEQPVPKSAEQPVPKPTTDVPQDVQELINNLPKNNLYTSIKADSEAEKKYKPLLEYAKNHPEWVQKAKLGLTIKSINAAIDMNKKTEDDDFSIASIDPKSILEKAKKDPSWADTHEALLEYARHRDSIINKGVDFDKELKGYEFNEFNANINPDFLISAAYAKDKEGNLLNEKALVDKREVIEQAKDTLRKKARQELDQKKLDDQKNLENSNEWMRDHL